MKNQFLTPTGRQAAGILCSLALLGSVHSLFAQSTWNGGSASDSDWSDAANWGGTVVVGGSTVTFGGTARQTNTNDLSGLTFTGVTLSTANWNISGNPVTLTGNFTANVGGTSTWDIPTVLGGGISWAQSGSGDIIQIPGYLSGSGSIYKSAGSAGQGQLYLSNLTNSFTGIVDVRTGTIYYYSLAPGGQPSSLGAGTGTITVGYTGTSYGGTLTYLGTNNGETDRALSLQDANTSAATLNNNSPSNSNLTFNGPVTFTDNTAGDYFPTALGGTSTGTNTFNGLISSGIWSGNINITGAGTWAFNNGINVNGNLTVAATAHLVLGYTNAYPNSTVLFPTMTLASGATMDVSGYDQNSSIFVLGEYAGYPQTLVAGRSAGAAATDINGSLSLASGATLNIAGINTPGTLTISSNFVTGSGTIDFDLDTNTTAGSGVNDLILVGGNLDLSQGNATIAVNGLKNGAVATNTPYTLIAYSGSLIGNASGLSVPAPGPQYTAGVVSTATPGLVQVTFGPSGGAVPNLVWQGNDSADWDANITANWLNGVSSAYFANGDNVIFNDTSSQTDVNLVGTLAPGTVTVSNNVDDYTLSSSSGGYISGGAGMIKQGSGELTLTTANAYSGGTVISAGTVSAGNATALGSGAVTLGDVNTGANAVSLLVNDGAAIANPITVSSGGTGVATIGYESGANSTMNGPITLQRDLVIYSANPTTGYSLLMQGGITGTGDVTIAGGGSVKWQTAACNFTGDLYLMPGTNASPAANTTYLGAGSVLSTNCNVNVASNTVFGEISSSPFNALNGGGQIEPGYGAAYNPAVYIGTAGGSGTFSGSFTINSLGYSCSLVKNGAGTEILTGDNSTSSAGTTVNAGILEISNSTGSGVGLGGVGVNGGTLAVNNTGGYGIGEGAVTIGAGGTLLGTGSIYSATNTLQVSGVLSVGNPGDTSGQTFTVQNGGISFNAGGALDVDLFSGAGAGDNTGNPAAADVLNAPANVTLNTNSVLNVANPNGMTAFAIGDQWKIADWSATPTGAFTTLNLPALPGTMMWSVTNLYSAGVIAVVANTATPTQPANITGVSYTGGNLVLTGTNLNGGQNFHYVVLTSMNLAMPLTNWTVLSTNSFNADGTFNYTNAINPTNAAAFFDVKAVQ